MCWDACGHVASGLVLAAFAMREMVPLRVAALLSNLAFIAYGLALGLTPIWLLHAILVPLNGSRLVEAVRPRGVQGGRRAGAKPPAMLAAGQ
jgi:CRP/FNR family transcriptional regulator, cyclic AMP receptor protein